jgi:hypothetical protein
MRRLSYLIIIIFSLYLIAYAGYVFSEYSVTPASNKVTVTWVTKSESGVSKFIILRSSDDRNFSEVGSVMARGAMSNYTFSDNNVMFKGPQIFFYKIRAVKGDNSQIEETQSLIVNPDISSILRTWGAIKSLFR